MSAIVVTESINDVPAVVQALEESLSRRQITLFVKIDHAARARDVGLDLPPEVVLIFGSPAVGTPLMQADARVGLDLPLRMLVWSEGGSTRIAYSDPEDLGRQYDLPDQRLRLAAMHRLLRELAEEAAGP